jgi:hypothetical protein
MSSIGARVLNGLQSVERPGDFCVGGIREIFMPTIDVDGVGNLSIVASNAGARQSTLVDGNPGLALTSITLKRCCASIRRSTFIVDRRVSPTVCGMVEVLARQHSAIGHRIPRSKS